MIAIFSPAEGSITVESRRKWQFMPPTFVDIGYQLRVLICAVNCRVERHFATFADVPYHDPLGRQQLEQLWKTDP
jgi:hypothetical protein